MSMEFIYNNKVVLVTGGLSGIGYKMCEKFLMCGAYVYTTFVDGKKSRLNQEKALMQISSKISFVKADVTKSDDWKTLIAKIKKEQGKLDFLINNAGVSINDNYDNYSYDEYLRVISVNLAGKSLGISESLDLLRVSESPCVVNIASRLATMPKIDSLSYCTAAAGIIMLTKVSALELAKFGIRVNSVSPSLTLTPMAMSSYSEEEIENTARNNPMKRLCETEDIANVVLFLCSEYSGYINGTNVDVNGGNFF